MIRIAFTIAASLVGLSAFAADFQQKPVDFNNGQLATYPPKVEGREPPSRVPVAPVGPDMAGNAELAAYPWTPTSDAVMRRPMGR